MKAICVEEFGGSEVLVTKDVPDLVPEEGEIVVRIHAAGVNPVDTYIRSGTYAKLPTLPYTPGSDGAGRVETIGVGVEGFKKGDRVYVSGSLSGTYAELCVCNTTQVHPLPETSSFPEGAAIGVPYATAHHALFSRARAKSGETVLIHGGTGGVGLAALQFSKNAGLTVFATGGTETGRVLLYEQGADEVFDHHAIGYTQQIMELTADKGVDVILEMLANVNLATDLTLIAPRGRIAIIGSRGSIEINPRDAMRREAEILGVLLTLAAPEERAGIHIAIQNGLTAGSIRPVIDRQFTLERAPEAHEAVLASGAHGKVVLLL